MKRQEFGELVAALRQDMGWTQFQLAEYADVDHAVISQIERGVKKFFEPDLLFCLANALQLTTLERREFLFAANGLDENQLVRQAAGSLATRVSDPERILEKMLALLGQIRAPAFIWDVYGDFVAANYMMLAFYNVPSSMLETAANIPGGYNAARVNFGRDMLARRQVTDNWDQYALNSIRSFRENSLSFRAKPYFKYLMKAFRNPAEYPLFDRYWKLVSSTEQDKDLSIDYFAYHHNIYGPLNYIANSTVGVTSFGNLILVQNLPLDQHTDDVFNELKSKAGFGIVRLAPWPEKSMP